MDAQSKAQMDQLNALNSKRVDVVNRTKRDISIPWDGKILVFLSGERKSFAEHEAQYLCEYAMVTRNPRTGKAGISGLGVVNAYKTAGGAALEQAWPHSPIDELVFDKVGGLCDPPEMKPLDTIKSLRPDVYAAIAKEAYDKILKEIAATASVVAPVNAPVAGPQVVQPQEEAPSRKK